MSLRKPSIGLGGFIDVGEELRAKQAHGWFDGLECQQLAKYLASVVACHPDWGDLSGPCVHVKIRSAVDVGTSVGKVNRSLRVVRKAREKLLSYRDNLVGLVAHPCYLPSKLHVLTVTVHAPKRIAGK